MGRTLVWLAVCLAVVPVGAVEVRSVELRAEVGGRRMDELMDLVVVAPGEELVSEAVRRSLRNLQASGRVGRAEAFVEREVGGARVIFKVYSRLQVASVVISGNDCMRESLLRATLEQRAQTPLSDDRLIRGVYRLRERLEAAGYLDSRVVLDVRVDEGSGTAEVEYRVDCGEPTLVEEVRFFGDLEPFTEEALLERLRMTAGKRFERSKLAEESERLEAWLIGEGRVSAEVDRAVEARDPQRRTVVLTYPVEVGPELDLEVAGFEIDVLRERGLLRALEEERFDEALLLQTVALIKTDFQKRGHYRAEVRGEAAVVGARRLVTLFVAPGPVFTIRSLRFAGNELVPTSELEQRVETSAARRLARSSGRLVDETLDEDLANLRSYYALQGLAKAEIGPAEVSETEEPGALSVVIPIVEGPRRRVVDLSFEGLTAFSPASRTFPIAAGGPYHPRRVENTVAEIRAVCEDLGYLSAQVTSRVSFDPTGARATVVIEVLQGPQVTVDRVILRGQVKTRREVILKSLGLEAGDPVSRRKLLAAQRELYRLGIFSRVEVKLAPAMPFAARRDVLVRLEEGRPQKGSLGVGYDSEDGFRALLGYSHTNLLGRAIAARLDLRASERERQARVLVRQPLLFGRRIPLTYSLFGVEEREESFDSERTGVQIDGEIVRGDARFGLLLTVKEVRVVDPDPALEAIQIDRALQQVDVASLTPSLFVDRRNDPLVPSRGWTSSLQAEYAFPGLGGRTEFLKLFGQQTGYLDLGPAGVVAASVRLGAIEPLDRSTIDPTVPTGLESASVPISERFFAGGRTSHRAYRRDLLGLEGETLLLVEESGVVRRVPIGGNGLLLANLDYRFPIAGALGGTAFIDAGNVFGNWRDADPGELEYGAGLGIRYLSPLGPLRLEVGWKLDRKPGESSAVVFLSFGNPF